MFLKKISKLILIIFLYLFLSFPLNAKDSHTLEKNKIFDYLENIKEFSSDFYQNQNSLIQEGSFYIKKNRLRIEYHTPTKIIFVIKESNAMYYNVDLEEVEYFNPKRTIGKVFLDIFHSKSFVFDAEILIEEASLSLEKKININDELNTIKIIFETKPMQIRKIVIQNSSEKIEFTIINPNFNPVLNDKIFSLANPLLS